MTENEHRTTGNANNIGNVVLTIIAIAFYAIQFLRPAPTGDATINAPDIDIIPQNDNDFTP